MPEPCECPARKALELARRALEANRHQYLAYGDGFTFCCGCGEREPHGEQAANPCGIPHSPNCPHTLQSAATDSINAALAAPFPCEGLREQWECFHCGFKTSDPSEAEAHFGERDDAQEFTPTCTWWSRLSADERAQEFQDLQQELNGEREESGQLNIKNEGLEHRLLELENVIDSRFKGARSINDIFHLYDTMEGLKLVAEAERDQLRAELAEALDYKRAAEAYILRLRQIVYAGRPEVVSQAKDEIRQWDLAGSVERAATVLAKHGKVKA